MYPENTSTQNTVEISIGSETANEFRAKVVSSVLRTLKLVFERRELDLSDEDSYALYCLADLAEKLLD